MARNPTTVSSQTVAPLLLRRSRGNRGVLPLLVGGPPAGGIAVIFVVLVCSFYGSYVAWVRLAQSGTRLGEASTPPQGVCGARIQTIACQCCWSSGRRCHHITGLHSAPIVEWLSPKGLCVPAGR